MGDNLDRKEYFNMADGGKLIAKVPLSLGSAKDSVWV